jgi:4-amino-4-deoxy-L-arabinose transferase-like glycosyltransferase
LNERLERFDRKRGRTLLILAVVVLTAGGAALRLYDLGSLGFFGDEETTAFAARSLAEGQGSAMPSGMPYRRALPYTWLNAVSAARFGLDEEIGYRVPAAVIGAATIPLIYLAGAAIAGPMAGLTAALLLATSGWHLVWSRTARMYVPALFAALAFFWLAWRWQLRGRWRDLMGAFGIYLLAVFLHSGTAAIVLFPILFALLYDGDRVPVRWAALATAAMAGSGWLLDRRFVVAPYERWASGFSSVESAPAGQLLGSLQDLASGLPPAAWLLLPLGFGVGWQWARSAGALQKVRSRERSRVTALLAGLAVAFGFTGLPYAAITMGIGALLLDARGARAWWRPAWVATAAGGSALGFGIRALSSVDGLSELLRTPFPYLPYLATLLPVFTALFALCLLHLAVDPGSSAPSGHTGVEESSARTDDRPVRAAALFVLAYCLALGFAVSWAPWRYLLIAYPWLILVVATGIAAMLRAVVGRLPKMPGRLAQAVTAVLLLAGIIGGHGLPASRTVVQARHGSAVPWNDPDLVIRPDHRSSGRFVRRHAGPGDIVIAEDALEQRWYVGRVDYWFRSERDASRYLYLDDAGVRRDIYVGAELLADPPPPSLLEQPDHAVWLITSGETAGARDWYLNPAQASWLTGTERTRKPAHRSEDGLGAVYCFGRCP